MRSTAACAASASAAGACATVLGRVLGVGLLLAAAGCVTTPVPGPMGTDPAPPARGPEPVEHPAEPDRSDKPVLVVLDDAHHAALPTLQVLSARLGRPYQILNLAHRSPAAVERRLAAAAPAEVIALGGSAHAVASGIGGNRVVHAAVFEAPAGTGIDALPPFDVQLDQWLRLTPGLNRIGVAGSEAVSSRMSALAAACESRGLVLDQRTVRSDQELLLAFRSMVPRIDGFVFLPDESVLSPRVIQLVIAHAARNNVQTLVYSPVMYDLGATLYLAPDPVRVAEALVVLLNTGEGPRAVAELKVLSRVPDAVARADPRTDL